jgi:hypothetical protein
VARVQVGESERFDTHPSQAIVETGALNAYGFTAKVDTTLSELNIAHVGPYFTLLSPFSHLTSISLETELTSNDVHQSRNVRERLRRRVGGPFYPGAIGFLAVHEDRALKTREIAAQIELDEGGVSTALSRLKERGLVEHKATYWAVTTDDSRLEGYSGYERATALFNEPLGEEDKDKWREHAPDEPHPSVEEE